MASPTEPENKVVNPYNPYVLNTEIPNQSPIPGKTDAVCTPMLRIELIRLETSTGKEKGSQNRTIGVLLVNGKFWSDTIEDSDFGWDQNTPEATIRKIKNANPKKTAIPTGEYYVRLMNGGRFAATKKPALMVSDTPNGADKILGFENIRLHAGANSEYTEGCILMGINLPQANQLDTRDSLPFNKEELGGGSNPRWTSNPLRDLLAQHGEIATFSVRRNYPVQSLRQEQEVNQPKLPFTKKQMQDQEKEKLNNFKAFRNDVIFYNSLRPYKIIDPALPVLSKKK